MLSAIVLSSERLPETCHRPLACGCSTKVSLPVVVTVIYMTVDLAFCGVPGGADRALEWTSVSFAMVAGGRNSEYESFYLENRDHILTCNQPWS